MITYMFPKEAKDVQSFLDQLEIKNIDIRFWKMNKTARVFMPNENHL